MANKTDEAAHNKLIKRVSDKPGLYAGAALMAILGTYLMFSPSEDNTNSSIADIKSLDLAVPDFKTKDIFTADPADMPMGAKVKAEDIVNLDAPLAEEAFVSSMDEFPIIEEPELIPVEPLALASLSKPTVEPMVKTMAKPMAKQMAAPMPEPTAEKKSTSKTPLVIKTPEKKPALTAQKSHRKAVKSWVFAKNAELYTVQLISSSNKKYILDFMEKNKKQNGLSYFQTINKNKSWYVVVQDSFKTFSAANKARKQLPESLAINGPWVRKFSSIQKEISANAEKIILLNRSFAGVD